ncbi:MAG: nucleotidyl transferase AbiEii/AbiGii toxin family protein, partial [Pseudonocardiaceae bacterium]
MTGLGSALLKTVAELTRLGMHCALIGGLAVSVRTEPRFTRDIDLAVAVRDDADAERLVNSLANAGFRIDTVVGNHSAGTRRGAVRSHAV